MDEQGRGAGGGQRCGDLARHMAGFAHAADDDPPARSGDPLDRRREGGAEVTGEGPHEDGDAVPLGFESAEGRGESLLVSGGLFVGKRHGSRLARGMPWRDPEKASGYGLLTVIVVALLTQSHR